MSLRIVERQNGNGSDAMSGRIKKWQFWCRVFAPLLDREPEFFPLLVRWYSRVEIPSYCRNLEVVPALPYSPWRWTQPPCERNAPSEPIHVLIDPLCDRPNCLGACRALSARFPPDQPYAYVKGSRRKIAFDDSERVIIVRDRLRHCRPARIIKLINLLQHRFGEIDGRLARLLLRHLPITILWLSVIQIRIAEASRILVNHNVQWFITPNEQSPLSSIFLVASKLSGIRTAQFLHGIPCALYTPFWSDEFWVWGETTRDMVNAALDWRPDACLVSGALEFADSRSQKQLLSPEERIGGVKRLLFLAQDVGHRVWESDAFAESVTLIADAVAKIAGWQVLLRSHPQATDREQRDMSSAFTVRGVAVAHSKDPLREDVENCDFVCTASSSAILEALLAGKPVRLVWNDGLDKIHGAPFLPAYLVARTSAELAAALNECQNNISDQGVTQLVMGSRDPAKWMTARIAAGKSTE